MAEERVMGILNGWPHFYLGEPELYGAIDIFEIERGTYLRLL